MIELLDMPLLEALAYLAMTVAVGVISAHSLMYVVSDVRSFVVRISKDRKARGKEG